MSTDILLLDPSGCLAVSASKVNTLAYWNWKTGIHPLHTGDTERKGQWGQSHKINQSLFLLLPTSLPHPSSNPTTWTAQSDLLSFMFRLTSEMKVAQVVCNDLLGGLLCAEFDSTREKDVPFPSRDNSMAFMRHLDIRYTNDAWKQHRLLTGRQTQVAHRGTFQCCIWGTTEKTTRLRPNVWLTLGKAVSKKPIS